MKAPKYPSFLRKVAGLVSVLNVILFMDPAVGVVIFATASILNESANRIGDLLDHRQANSSFDS